MKGTPGRLGRGRGCGAGSRWAWWVGTAWESLLILPAVPQGPAVLGRTGGPLPGSGLQTCVPPTGAHSHRGRGCTKRAEVLFFFIIKLLGTPQR